MNKQGYGSKEEIRKIAEKVWDSLMGFASYAFPKAHSTSYGLILNATQYLKVHYPVEFFCSLLEYAEDKEYNYIKAVAQNSYGVRFIMPDINISKTIFSIHKDRIVWSLTSIKGIGPNVADEIVSKQPFDTFEDFFNKVNKTKVNVGKVKAMIACNVFKRFGNRNKIMKKYLQLRKDSEPFKAMSKGAWDFEMNQLIPYARKSIQDMFPDHMTGVMTFKQYYSKKNGSRVVIAGTIEGFREVKSKRGLMYIMTVSDVGNNYGVVCWNDMVKRLKEEEKQLSEGIPVKISGIKGLSHMGEMQVALSNNRQCYVRILK